MLPEIKGAGAALLAAERRLPAVEEYLEGVRTLTQSPTWNWNWGVRCAVLSGIAAAVGTRGR